MSPLTETTRQAYHHVLEMDPFFLVFFRLLFFFPAAALARRPPCLSVLCSGGEVTPPRFTQYFRGSLSGLTIRPGRIETQKVISCLQACKEGLDINSLESLAKDIKVGTL